MSAAYFFIKRGLLANAGRFTVYTRARSLRRKLPVLQRAMAYPPCILQNYAGCWNRWSRCEPGAEGCSESAMSGVSRNKPDVRSHRKSRMCAHISDDSKIDAHAEATRNGAEPRAIDNPAGGAAARARVRFGHASDVAG